MDTKGYTYKNKLFETMGEIVFLFLQVIYNADCLLFFFVEVFPFIPSAPNTVLESRES